MNTQCNSEAAARILVVDDNPSMREAIAIMLEGEPDLTICGEASGIAEALEQCEALHPNLALIDLSLRGEDGLELVKHLSECAPDLHCVVFSLHDEQLYIDGAREAGARGYVIKSGDPGDVLVCIHRVLEGNTCFPQPKKP